MGADPARPIPLRKRRISSPDARPGNSLRPGPYSGKSSSNSARPRSQIMEPTDTPVVRPPSPLRSRSLRTRAVSLAAGLLFTIGFIVWPGCATPPLPSSRTPVSALKRADMAFAKNSHPAKSEVIAKLGPPDKYFPDIRVACYKLNYLSRHRLWLFLGAIPIAAVEDEPGVEVAMFQFDAGGQTQRHAIRTIRKPYSWWGPMGTLPRDAAGAVEKEYFTRAMKEDAHQWVVGDARKN